MTFSSKAQTHTPQPPETPGVVRLIEWYEKQGDRLLGEATLKDIALSDLQTLFKVSSDNPMYECYPIGSVQVEFLQSKLDHRIDLEQSDYYLSCYREETD
jgi:hypothetical protein